MAIVPTRRLTVFGTQKSLSGGGLPRFSLLMDTPYPRYPVRCTLHRCGDLAIWRFGNLATRGNHILQQHGWFRGTLRWHVTS